MSTLVYPRPDFPDPPSVSIDVPDVSEDVEPVLRANLFHVVRPARDGAAAHVVQLTGAVGGPNAEQDYELIRGVIGTVQVRPWSAGAPGA